MLLTVPKFSKLFLGNAIFPCFNTLSKPRQVYGKSITYFVKFPSKNSIFFIAVRELALFLLKTLLWWLHGLTTNK